MSSANPIYLLSCAGIEKSEGWIATQAMYNLMQQALPNTTLIAPAALSMNVGGIQSYLQGASMIIVDGCAERCALKLAAKYKGKIKGRLLVTTYIQKHHQPHQAKNDLSYEIIDEIQKDILRLLQEIQGK